MSNLWKHQQVAVEFARSHKNVALLFDVGTGKTPTAIEILREEYNLRHSYRRTVIFAPVSVCPQWKREIARWMPAYPQDRVYVLTGSGVKRRQALEQIRESGRGAIVITNYESTRIEKFYLDLAMWRPEIIVLDEMQRIKSPTALCSKRIYPLCDAAERKVGLTGTPITNGLMEIWGQYRALEPAIFGQNFFQFRIKYFYDRNAGMPSHCHFPDFRPRAGAEKELAERIARIAVYAKKEECIDLPPLLNVPVEVELSDKQREAYDSMERDFIAELNGQTVTAEFAMTKALRLQQIIAGYVPGDEGDVWDDGNPRLVALTELLEQLKGNKTIVWSVFRATYEKIADACEKTKRSWCFLTGEQTAKQKEESIEMFCRGDVETLIANPAAGGVGVNLTEAAYSVYYTRGYSLEQYLQSVARNFRAGSAMHQKVTHYLFRAPGTIDDVIDAALEKNMSVAKTIEEWARKKSLTHATAMSKAV